MNINNALRTASLIAAGALEIIAKVGECTTDAVTTVCTASWLTPALAHDVTIGVIILNLVLKAVRPGGILGGLFGATAVVSDSGAAGTVTASSVATPGR